MTPDRPGSVRLFTHSFLYFGQQQSMLRLDALLIENGVIQCGRESGSCGTAEQAKKDDGKIKHPCMPKGKSRNWNEDSTKFLQEGIKVAAGTGSSSALDS